MITFAPLTDCDAPRVPTRQRKIAYDRVLELVVSSLIAYEESMASEPPQAWPWRPFDPRLQEIFDAVNQRYFGGRVGPHRLFWFDSAGFDDEDDVGIDSCNRSMGFRTVHDQLGPAIGINLRLKLAPVETTQVVRHECCHALVGADEGHGPLFRAALLAQGPSEEWCRHEVRRYELLDSDIVDRIYEHFASTSGGSSWVGAIPRLRRFLAELDLTNDDLNQIVDVLSPHVRAVILRAVTFQPREE